MQSTIFGRKTKRRNESGQAMLFTLLVLGIFLIGAMAFAIDLSNTWFNRQSAQTAADAACTAGVMDMLVLATDGTMPSSANFTSGTAFDCFSTPTAAPCSYAALNGFGSTMNQSSANSGALGTNVYVDFPTASSVNLSSLSLPSASVAASALMRVRVTRTNSTWFGALLGTTKQGSGASAICAVINATSPIPILVLHPTKSASLLLNGGGSVSNTGCGATPCGDIVIAGGPAKSIQVNSSSATAINFNGGPTIDLCAGGNNYCGSSLGVWGAVPNPGTTNFWSTSAICTTQNTTQTPALCSGSQNPPQWNQSPPIADPLATVSAPSVPIATFGTGNNNGVHVGYHVSGCPENPTGCQLFSPGYYPNGIDVQGETAIFSPGIYYLAGSVSGCSGASFCEDSTSCIRPSTDQGDGSGGTIFYFSDANSVLVKANGGQRCNNPPGGATVDAFPIMTGPVSTTISYLTTGVRCTSSSTVPPNLQSVGSLTGSVLLAPCNTPSVSSQCASAGGNANCSLNFGDPLGASDPSGVQRGILFFQNRSVNASSNPSWSGGGSMLLAGTMYFHQCVSGGSDTGLGCTGSVWNDQLTLGGNSGSSTYVLGDIIVDQLHVGGSGQIIMDLNPSAAYTTLKAALVQ
jgi:hypothetical protein